jgi:quercetin dioxygenase-like cupin family protein
VVAGVGQDGRAVVLSDGPPAFCKDTQGVEIADLWRFEGPPRVMTDGGDASLDEWKLWTPDVGGFAWRVVRFTSANPELHATPTIDLVTILDGRIDLILEDEPVRLEVGDSAVIQGCLHGWRLIEEEPCTMLAVMVRVQGQATGRQEA